MTTTNFENIKTGETFIYNDCPYRKVPSQFDPKTKQIGRKNSNFANAVSRPDHKSFCFNNNVQVVKLQQ